MNRSAIITIVAVAMVVLPSIIIVNGLPISESTSADTMDDGQIFEENELVYTVSGTNTVTLTDCKINGDAIIPATVKNGEYTVTKIACKNLSLCKTLTLPSTVTEIDYDCFFDSTCLTDIFVEAGNTTFASIGGILVNASGDEIILGSMTNRVEIL